VLAHVLRELGTPPMPWQRLVGDVALEYDPDTGMPAYREVIVSVPRQSGKTQILLARLTMEALEIAAATVAYSAQTGSDARRKLIHEFARDLRRSRLRRLVERVYEAMGDPAVVFGNESRIRTVAAVQDAGHGLVLDAAVIDEAWADPDDRREAALVPTMSTRPRAQLWVASTAGTDDSVYWHRKVALGRHLAASGDTSTVAYFEWSAPPDAEADDEDVWWACHPALGHTISVETLRHAHRTMTEPEFRRAYLNQPTSGSDERVIPQPVWDAACDLKARVRKPERFAADAMPDRSAAAIAVAGGGVAELVDSRIGVTWLPEALATLWARYRLPIVIDAQGPLAGMASDLERAGVRVQKVGTGEVTAACARFLDRLVDGKVTIRRSEQLDEAVAAVRKRPLGDRWLWSRQSSVSDVSPIVALTLAVGIEGPETPTAVRLLRLD
jgi:hypothetical protein